MPAAAEAKHSHRHGQGKPSATFLPWQVQPEWRGALLTDCNMHSPNNYFKQVSAFLRPSNFITRHKIDFSHSPVLLMASSIYQPLYKPPLCYRSPQALCLQLNIPVRIYHPTAWQLFIFTSYKGAVKRLIYQAQKWIQSPTHSKGCSLRKSQFQKQFFGSCFSSVISCTYRVPQNLQSEMISTAALIPNCIPRTTDKPLTGSRNVCLMRK